MYQLLPSPPTFFVRSPELRTPDTDLGPTPRSPKGTGSCFHNGYQSIFSLHHLCSDTMLSVSSYNTGRLERGVAFMRSADFGAPYPPPVGEFGIVAYGPVDCPQKLGFEMKADQWRFPRPQRPMITDSPASQMTSLMTSSSCLANSKRLCLDWPSIEPRTYWFFQIHGL